MSFKDFEEFMNAMDPKGSSTFEYLTVMIEEGKRDDRFYEREGWSFMGVHPIGDALHKVFRRPLQTPP